jgi:hypothetical protein
MNPLHPVEQMTTSELAGYRRNLEHALSAGEHDDDRPSRETLQSQLAGVLAEEEDRRRIARAGSHAHSSV